ncbi:unnamed protein product [Pylaiella littoralis]
MSSKPAPSPQEADHLPAAAAPAAHVQPFVEQASPAEQRHHNSNSSTNNSTLGWSSQLADGEGVAVAVAAGAAQENPAPSTTGVSTAAENDARGGGGAAAAAAASSSGGADGAGAGVGAAEIATAGSAKKEGGPQAQPRSAKRSREALPVGLPKSMVRRIMKLGEETRNISNEALIIVVKASELFLERFSTRAFDHAEKLGRKTIKYRDVSDVRVQDPNLLFLEAVVPP